MSKAKTVKALPKDPAKLISCATGNWWQDDRRNWCAYCGKKLVWEKNTAAQQSATRDHVLPKSNGGKVMIPSCVGCNKAKANRSAAEFVTSKYFAQNRGKRPETEWSLRDLWLVMAMEAVLQAKRHSVAWPDSESGTA